MRGEDGLHRPGPALLRFGRDSTTADYDAVIRPYLKRLRNETGETASFYVRDGDERVCLLREIGHHELRHYVEEGSRLGLDRGAAARALVQPHQNDGVHISRGERVPGVAAIAVPVFDSQGGQLGAITLSGSTESILSSRQDRFIELLREAARQIRARF